MVSSFGSREFTNPEVMGIGTKRIDPPMNSVCSLAHEVGEGRGEGLLLMGPTLY
jgi:hypothetical protein